MNWKPIETANKEDRILAYRPDDFPKFAVCYWDKDTFMPHKSEWSPGYNDWCAVTGARFVGATHWMPVPEPPQQPMNPRPQ